MKKSMMILFALLCVAYHAKAADRGFRFRDGRCLDANGREGLNPYFLGQCSDMRGVALRGLEFQGLDISGSRFDNSDIQEINFENSNLNAVNFDFASFTDVNFKGAIVYNSSFENTIFNKVNFSKSEFQNSGFFEAVIKDSNFTEGKFQSCRFKKASLKQSILTASVWRNSDLSEAKFTEAHGEGANFAGSIIDSADFFNAQLERANFSRASGNSVYFVGAKLTSADFSESRFQDSQFRNADMKFAILRRSDFTQSNFNRTNLTGAVVDGVIFKEARYSKTTLLPFAEEKAKEFGMKLDKSKRVYLLWDTMTDKLRSFATALSERTHGQIEIDFSAMQVRDFDGSVTLIDYDAVIFFVGSTDGYAGDLADNGQKSLVKYVENGGLFISGEWLAYLVSNNYYQSMLDLVLFHRETGNADDSKLVLTEDGKSDPILSGMKNPIEISYRGENVGPVVAFDEGPVKVLANTERDRPAIALRDFGRGQVLAFNFACTDEEAKCLNDTALIQIYINAILNR